MLLCPFCEIPHPVGVGKVSACGTELRVTAVQTLIPTRTVHKHNLTCFKCGKSGGEMVPFNEGYIHLIDCVPGTKVMAEPPGKFSPAAKFVYGLPVWMRSPIERYAGVVKRIDGIDAKGKETGETLGYIFYREAQT